MKKSTTIITFSLLGLAIGAATYYLLTTDDGKDKLKKANSDIKKLTKSIKKISKKKADKLTEVAKSYKKELENA